MAFSKIIAESMDLADTYAFTGTVTGAGGGITEADTFRLTSAQDLTAGVSTVITGFTRDNESSFSKIGTGMSESSGVFTMGSTGIYYVIASFYLGLNGSLTYGSTKLQATTNNSSYHNRAYNDDSIKQVVGVTYATSYLSCIFDCQDTSTHKLRLSAYGTQNMTVYGGSGDNHTYLTVIRLADT